MTSEAWLRLLAAAAGGGHRWIQALHIAGSAETLVSSDAAPLRTMGLGADEVSRLKTSHDRLLESWIAWLDEPGHDLIVYRSERYPTCLAELDDAPLALWLDGQQPMLLASPKLAIVGSRHPTQNGLRIAESFAARASDCGITVTSGLARGIDAAGHQGALEGIGKTVAVLGNGIDHVYPAANRQLASRIREQGIIVSEYAPATPVRPFQFPRRNRIIASLSLGTLVIEATRRSGSLITARLAAEYGREVFAVPGSIHSALSKGCHKLIRSGAQLVENLDDVLIEIAPQLRVAARKITGQDSPAASTELPESLAASLDYAPQTFDELAAATGLTAAELSSMLLHLEIQGKIEALPGGRYCRLAKRA